MEHKLHNSDVVQVKALFTTCQFHWYLIASAPLCLIYLSHVKSPCALNACKRPTRQSNQTDPEIREPLSPFQPSPEPANNRNPKLECSDGARAAAPKYLSGHDGHRHDLKLAMKMLVFPRSLAFAHSAHPPMYINLLQLFHSLLPIIVPF